MLSSRRFLQEYFKHLLIRTSLEEPAMKARRFLGSRQRSKYPELNEIYLEPLVAEQVLQRILRDSSNCIDVGCHLGSTLSTILRLAPQGHHMAFEPLPYKARWLKQKFPEVDVRELALSDTSGKVTFYCNTHQTGFSGLRRQTEANNPIQELPVRCECLDRILPPDYRIDFIKLDVEGGELSVLRGATSILHRYCPTLLFECTDSGLSRFGLTSTQVFEFLTRQHAYSVFLLRQFLNDGEPLNFEQFHKAQQYPFKAFNFIAVAN